MESAVTLQNGAHTVPGRNPRRRARKEVEETGSLRLQPLRKRHKTMANGSRSAPLSSDLMNGHVTAEDSQPSSNFEVAIRERASGSMGEGVTASTDIDIFAKNENYVIGQLPALPQELRAKQEGKSQAMIVVGNFANHRADFRGHFLLSESLACAVTRQSAYIWDYTARSTTPTTRLLKLPFPSKTDEPLPLAKLVKPSQQSDVGLVVIQPRSGKIKYWENIQNADALNLFAKRRDGTEGTMGLFSGEVALDVEDAQHAGLVVTTSAGRVAQLQLRDTQSRPSVNIQYLRAPRRNASGGLFGGLMNVFGPGSLMKDVIAARVRPSKGRGPVEVVIGSEHGEFQHWQISWAEAPSLLSEHHLEETMESVAKSQLEQRLPGPIQSTRLLDFTFASPSNPSISGTIRSQLLEDAIIGLLMITGSSYSSYAICAINSDGEGGLAFGRTLLLDSYSAPLTTGSLWQPRLCISWPSFTAFALFEKAIVVISLADIQSTEAKISELFQDAVYLKDDDKIYVAGAAAELFDPKRKQSSIMFLVPGTAPLRLTTYESTDPSAARLRHKLSAQSKIEQVILYSNKQSNPLNLGRRPEYNFSREEVESAALEISSRILATDYSSLATHIVSLDLNLQKRAQALEALALHLKDSYPGLSRTTKWLLRFDAEKMAAAREIWKIYIEQISERGPRSKRKLLMPELIELMRSELRPESESPFRGIDQLRQFFLVDLDKLNYVLIWSYNAIFHLAQNRRVREGDNLLQLVLDATDVVSVGLETAFEFRSANASLYDLENEDMEDGVLRSGYQDLPNPWTSTYQTVSKIADLVGNAQTAVDQELADSRSEEREPTEIAVRIAEKNPSLIFAWWRIYEEYCRWCAASSDQSIQSEGSMMRKKLNEKLTKLLMQLPLIDQTFPGMELAEKIQHMPALTRLVREESQNLFRIASLCSEPLEANETIKAEKERLKKLDETQNKIEELEQRIARYCSTFGYAFTNPYYGAIVEKYAFGTLLDQSMQYRREVTGFLRAESSRRPLAWINEILAERDYKVAGNELMDLATSSESKAWNREVELGFAKLALLAADEEQREHRSSSQNGATAPPSQWEGNAARHDRTQAMLNIQSRLWEHVQDLTYNAVDEEGMVQLLMESLGRKLKVTSRIALYTLLEQAFDRLVKNDALGAEALIDLLTLMDRHTADREGYDVAGTEFFLALLALKNDASLPKESHETLSKMIWRRSMLADDPQTDWGAISKATNKKRLTDDDLKDLLRKTTLYRTFYEGYKLTRTGDSGSASQSAHNGPLTNGDVALSFMHDAFTPSPTECLEAGTRGEDWLARFGEDRHDLADPIARDMREEVTDLSKVIEEQQLSKWWQACKEVAVADVAEGR